ncbi:MAG TPA: hypothetical protein VKV18_02320 [Chthonomonas sp.]|uniref:hypothetical protein n=1 Tax=Chthonomonas sp. TaxID=2282153 RepID=UPI002B4B8B12|nr:hypothetical protein [Chthonomonas sp.]HLI47513.1 hypothetical protein [Chthonomonas sp.]
MIHCPNCKRLVEEDIYTHCPNCHHPLPSHPTVQLNMPPPHITPRTSSVQRLHSLIRIGFVLVLIGISLFGVEGYLQWRNQVETDQKAAEDTVKQFMSALAQQDMGTVYDLSLLPSSDEIAYPDSTSFADNFTYRREELFQSQATKDLMEVFALYVNPLQDTSQLDAATITIPQIFDSIYRRFDTVQIGQAHLLADGAEVPIYTDNFTRVYIFLALDKLFEGLEDQLQSAITSSENNMQNGFPGLYSTPEMHNFLEQLGHQIFFSDIQEHLFDSPSDTAKMRNLLMWTLLPNDEDPENHMGPFLLKLRKVNGTWRIDFTEFPKAVPALTLEKPQLQSP